MMTAAGPEIRRGGFDDDRRDSGPRFSDSLEHAAKKWKPVFANKSGKSKTPSLAPIPDRGKR
jgi:hypothetical protein